MINNMLNQQILGQQFAMHGQLPQLLQNLPGFAAPRGAPGFQPNPFPGGPGAQFTPTPPGPTTATFQSEAARTQQLHQTYQNMHQNVHQNMHQRERDAHNMPNFQNLQPIQQATNTAPVTRSSSPLVAPGSATNAADSSIQTSTGAAQPNAAQQNPPLGLPYPGLHHPSTGIQTTSGIGPDGQRFTITVQNSVVGYRTVGVPGQAPQGMPNVFPGQPQQVPNLNFPPFTAPNGQHMHLPQMVLPGQILNGHMHVPGPGAIPGGVSPVRTPSQGSTGAEDRNRRISDTMVVLSAQLYTISRTMQMIGGRIASFRSTAHNRQGVIREMLNCLRMIDEVEVQLREFDSLCSQYSLMYPEISSNSQYMQTMERRRGTRAALEHLLDMIQSEILAPTAQTGTSMMQTTNPIAARSPQATLSSENANTLNTSNTSNTIIPATSNEQQIYIVNDQNGSPYALLVGPTGQHASSPLPWNILQPLLSAQLPPIALARAMFNATNSAYAQTINSVRGHDVRSLGGTTLSSLRHGSNFRARPHRHRTAHNEIVPQAEAAQNAEMDGDAAQAVQPREPDEMRDLLAPIVRNLWLVIRIAGFTYLLFGGGRALWRPLLIGIALTIIWAAQAGMFGDRFDGLRRYLDRIVGIEAAAPDAGNQQNLAGANGQPNNEQPVPAGQADGANAGLNAQAYRPEDIARRLVEQRQQDDATWLMQQVRYVERMFGLFLASLWPGIGEQAVRLQEERTRQQEEHERIVAEQERLQNENDRLQEEQERGAPEQAEDTSGQPDDAPSSSEVQDSTTVLPSPTEKNTGSSSSAAIASEESSISRVNKGKEKATEQTPEEK